MKAVISALLVALFAAPVVAQQVIVDPAPDYDLFNDGIPEAPVDGQTYGRQNESWSPVTGTFPEAPTDGQQYARQDASWQVVDAPAPPPADAECDYDINLSDGGTLADVQDAINEWNVYSDTDGDGKNDKLRVCVRGTATIDGSDAITSYVQNGSTTGSAVEGGSKFYLKVSGVNPALAGCGLRGASPVACATANMQDNLMRTPQKSLPLYLYFEDVVIFADRDNWAATTLPIVFLQVGDGYHTGGMQFTDTSTGYNNISDVIALGGNLSILTVGDGDGLSGLRPTPVPPRFGTDKLLADPTSFVGLFYDMATRIYDQGFVYTYRWSPPSVSSQGNKDETTIGFFNRHTWSHGNFMSSIQNVGVSMLFQSVANVQTFQGYRGEMRGGRLGFVFGDPYYGCDTVYFSANAGNASQNYYPCNGVKIDATYEGSQSVIFGNVGNLELRGYSEGNQTTANAHQWNMAAGANSVTGELCLSQAEAETQSSGSTCDTPYNAQGLSLSPVVGLNSSGANFGTVLFQGSMGSETIVDGKNWYTIAVGNKPDAMFLRFGDNFSGPGNYDPANDTLRVPFVCVSDDDCPGMVAMYGENMLGVGKWGNGIPEFYGGEWLRTSRTTVREDCSTWVWTDVRAPGEYGDICIETDTAQSTASLWVCLGMDDTTGYCRDGDLVQIAGGGSGGGTDPADKAQIQQNTTDIAQNASDIAFNAADITSVGNDATAALALANSAISTAGFQSGVVGTTVQKQPSQNLEIGGNFPGAGKFVFDNTAGDLTLRTAGGQIITTPAADSGDCMFLSESGNNGGSNGALVCVEDVDWSADQTFTFNADGSTSFSGGGGGALPYSASRIVYSTPTVFTDTVNTPLRMLVATPFGSGSDISVDTVTSTITFAEAGVYRITFGGGATQSASGCSGCSTSGTTGDPFARGSLKVTLYEAAGFVWSASSAPKGMSRGRDMSTLDFGTNGFPTVTAETFQPGGEQTQLVTVSAGQTAQLYLESTGLNVSQNSYTYLVNGLLTVERVE